MPSRYGDDLAEICEDAVQHLGLRNQAREQALPASREVIRFSANAIRAVHRGEFEEARQLLDRAAQRLKDTEAIREENPEIYFAGFMIDARKEYTEAHVTLAVLSGQKLPKPQDLGVEPSAFLNGMAEVIGEVRRPSFIEHIRGANVLDMITLAGGSKGNADLTQVVVYRMVDGVQTRRVSNINAMLSSGRLDQIEKINAGDLIYVPAKGKNFAGRSWQVFKNNASTVSTLVLAATAIRQILAKQ